MWDALYPKWQVRGHDLDTVKEICQVYMPGDGHGPSPTSCPVLWHGREAGGGECMKIEY